MPKALWKEAVLAESDATVVVDGNYYFPPDSVKWDFLKKTDTHTTWHWKGEASYYDVLVGEERNPDAAWVYPETLEKANNIKGYIAFWKGVKVE